MWKAVARNAEELLFPKRCFFCKKYGCLLCGDCREMLDVGAIHRPDHSKKHLADIYAACSYDNPRVKKLIHSFKYKPFHKELAGPLANLIASHLELSEQNLDFKNSAIASVPLAPKRLRWRGFNQAENIAQKLAGIWRVPGEPGCLIRIRETEIQAELSQAERRKNTKNAFICPDNSRVKNKSIFLVDDVATTGATLDECAHVLLKSGATEVFGIAVARTDK